MARSPPRRTAQATFFFNAQAQDRVSMLATLVAEEDESGLRRK
jgi:hypothetical protein